MTYICRRLNKTRQKVVELAKIDPTFPMFRLTENGNYVVDPEELEVWISKRKKPIVGGGLGVHALPSNAAATEAANDLRCVMLRGQAPEHSPYWRNAKFVRADLPPDIVAGFDLDPRASFENAAEHADKLLSLPSDKQAAAMKAIAARLAAFHGGDEV